MKHVIWRLILFKWWIIIRTQRAWIRERKLLKDKMPNMHKEGNKLFDRPGFYAKGRDSKYIPELVK
jgi:hypothetical protein